MKRFMRQCVIALVVLLVVMAGGAAVWFINDSFVNIPLFAGCVVLLAAASGMTVARYWSCVTGTERFAVNMAVHTLVFSVIFAGCAMLLNYMTADFDSATPTEVTVTKKFTKTRHRSRRVGRRYVANGDPYKVYYLEISVSGHGEKDIQVGNKVYSRFRKDDAATILIARGILGIEMMKPLSLEKLPGGGERRRNLE